MDRLILARLGKLVAADVVTGRLGPHSRSASKFLELQPQAVLDLLEMVIAESGKKRRNEKTVTAYAYMIGQALEFTRYGIEAGHTNAAELAESVRKRLLALGEGGQVEPALLLLILSQFATAKLNPGPELRELMEHLAEKIAPEIAKSEGVGALEQHFGELTRDVDGDPFLLYAHIGEMSEAFPEDHRAAMGSMMLQCSEVPVREAALGWLLDASASVRNSTASALEYSAAATGVSGAMLRRMIALRNWLPEPDRGSLDRAIHACRRKGVEISPWPQPQVREVLASVIDGAGAQSIFVVAREARRNAIACVLIKHGIGIRDAWARHGLTRGELDEFLVQVEGIDLLPIRLDYVRIAVAHALAVQKTPEVMPPFPLLDVLETAGLQSVQPEELPADRVLTMLADATDPAILHPEMAAEILKASGGLAEEMETLDSWFEDGTEVEQLLGTQTRSRAKSIAVVRDELLPLRTNKWVERLAWTSLTLQHGEQEGPWQEFFVSARELNLGCPINEIPLMMHVAANTVDACMATRLEKRNRPAGQRQTEFARL
jgi:hypothetical protein